MARRVGAPPLHSNGFSIDDPSTVPYLDPILVKATIMQESTMGTYDLNPNDRNDQKSDIMQANVEYENKPGRTDWGDHKLQFGLEHGKGATPTQSIRAGIRWMYQKGLKSVDKRDENGKIIGKTTTWIGGVPGTVQVKDTTVVVLPITGM